MENNIKKRKTRAEEKRIERKLKNVYQELLNRNLLPLKAWQGKKNIKITTDKKFRGVTFKRPFIVVEAAKIGTLKKSGKIKKVIYKGEIKQLGLLQDIEKEAIIYRDILPEIYKKLPNKIKKRVHFPKLIEIIKRKGSVRAIIRENIEGLLCGDYEKTKINILNKKDVEAICYVIKGFQKINPEKIRKKFPELPENNFFEIYKKKSEKYIKLIKKLLGDEYAAKMKKLLKKSKEIVPMQPMVLLSEDITTFNIIKMLNGKLGFFDWERPCVGRDASTDYERFILKLWTVPKLQKEAIKVTLKINQENPRFKDMFRASLVLFEGGYIFHDYFKRLKSNNLQKRKEAERAVLVFKKLFKDILDDKGVWQEKI